VDLGGNPQADDLGVNPPEDGTTSQERPKIDWSKYDEFFG
jgi:hypothetical protein